MRVAPPALVTLHITYSALTRWANVYRAYSTLGSPPRKIVPDAKDALKRAATWAKTEESGEVNSPLRGSPLQKAGATRGKECGRLLAVLFFFRQCPESKLSFRGGAILAGFVILPDGFQGPLDSVTVSGVPANFELARKPVQEASGENARRAETWYANLLAPKHETGRAIYPPGLTRCKDGT